MHEELTGLMTRRVSGCVSHLEGRADRRQRRRDRRDRRESEKTKESPLIRRRKPGRVKSKLGATLDVSSETVSDAPPSSEGMPDLDSEPESDFEDCLHVDSDFESCDSESDPGDFECRASKASNASNQ